MRTTATYSEDFKKNAIKKLLMPGNPGLSVTAKNIGIAPSTLFGWKEKYANQSVMKKATLLLRLHLKPF